MTHGALLALMVLIACTSGCASSIHQRPHVDGVLYPEPSANAITFWGHACAYIDVGGFGIVTDPVFMQRWVVVRHRLIPIPLPKHTIRRSSFSFPTLTTTISIPRLSLVFHQTR